MKSILALALGILILAGCGSPSTAPTPTQSPITGAQAKPADPPTKPILYQPKLHWDDGLASRQGTGSFVRAPNGEAVAITSAHFLDFKGPALKQVEWLDVRTGKTAATMTTSWNSPGDGGQSDARRVIDLRSDYLLMPAGTDIPSEVVLELDARAMPELNEAIWFPDKQPTAEMGYKLIGGKVVAVSPKFHTVELDEKIKPVSQSGSPIISQKSGKVLGIWGRVMQFSDGRIHLYLVPSRALLDLLERDNAQLKLENVVGKKGAKRQSK